MKTKVHITNIPATKAKKIQEDQSLRKRKTVLMKAELTAIAPQSMLFNALSIASSELARLNRLAQTGTLDIRDIRKYSLLINSLCKLSEENRLNQQEAHLTDLTEEEKIARVLEAIEVMSDEE